MLGQGLLPLKGMSSLGESPPPRPPRISSDSHMQGPLADGCLCPGPWVPLGSCSLQSTLRRSLPWAPSGPLLSLPRVEIRGTQDHLVWTSISEQGFLELGLAGDSRKTVTGTKVPNRSL